MPRPTFADGLQSFLDATQSSHNGHDYHEFDRCMRSIDKFTPDGFKVTKKYIARRFGINRHTLEPWIMQYNKDHATDDDRQTI